MPDWLCIILYIFGGFAGFYAIKHAKVVSKNNPFDEQGSAENIPDKEDSEFR